MDTGTCYSWERVTHGKIVTHNIEAARPCKTIKVQETSRNKLLTGTHNPE